jgi:hypothetical protein
LANQGWMIHECPPSYFISRLTMTATAMPTNMPTNTSFRV